MKKAIITGIAGQDGSYLAELLLEKGYDVHGLELPMTEDQKPVRLANISGILDRIHLHFGLLDHQVALEALVRDINPSECYHLAASSFVSFDFAGEWEVLHNNIQSTHTLLASLKKAAPGCRFFFAGTSEMFGLAASSPQNEETKFCPRSIYGISKVAGHNLIRYYRDQHQMFVCTGILYNHESPRRGLQFVTRKITSAVAKIKLGFEDKLYLGNLDALRDWGYAPDYVRAMWLMLQQNTPNDFVIASGELHSVREFVALAFTQVGFDYRNHVEVDPRFFRDAEKVQLQGDSSMAQNLLGWERTVSFAILVAEMVARDMAEFQ